MSDADRCVTDRGGASDQSNVGRRGRRLGRIADGSEWAVAQATGRDAQIVALCAWRAPILPSDAIGQPALLMDWDRFEAELRRHLDEIVASVRLAGAAVGPQIRPACSKGGRHTR